MITLKRFLVGLLAIGLMVGLAACNADYRTSSDEYGCLYDSYFNHLKRQLPPGSKISSDDRDVLVTIPASNRFYNITRDASRDPLAPYYLSASDVNQTAVRIEGQARMAFNPRNYCEWFSKHGRRNADSNGKLGFNARGSDAFSAGWFHWLTENFGLTLKQVAPNVMNQFDWARAYYHYPINAKDTGEIPAGEKRGVDTVVELGNQIGVALTEALKANLGGNYFCGVTVTNPGEDESCPPINFQVTAVYPVNGKLLTDRQQYEETKQELENARRTAKLAEENRKADKRAAKAQLEILQRQLQQQNLQAEIDFAPCRLFLQNGVNCDSNHTPLPVRSGDSITVNHGG